MKEELYSPIVIYKGRTNRVTIDLGINVALDTFASEIRAGDDSTSPLIATWVVSFLTDGADGKLVLTLDNSVSSTITRSSGFMDLKRITDGEPVPVFDRSIPVIIQNTVTA